MINNIGSTTLTLSTVIGETTNAIDPINLNTITMIAGELAVGAIITDTSGTVATVISYSLDESQNYVYTLKTISTYTEYDVESILNQEY